MTSFWRLGREIQVVERFQVNLSTRYGYAEMANYVDNYPFQDAAPGDWSVSMWRSWRFDSIYPQLIAEVIDNQANEVPDDTLVSAVRATYGDWRPSSKERAEPLFDDIVVMRESAVEDDEDSARWKREVAVLRKIGLVLENQNTNMHVTLPRDLAEDAIASWHILSEFAGRSLVEENERGALRTKAAILGVIGLIIQNRGKKDAEGVTVELSARLVSAALEAADELF